MKTLFISISCLFLLLSLPTSRLRRAESVTNNYLDGAKAEQDGQEKQAAKEWKPEEQGIGDLTEPSREETLVPLDKRKPLVVVGRLFSPDDFARYIKYEVAPEYEKEKYWKPDFIVLHHTGIPSIAQRPEGFSVNNMSALAHYYGVKQGWRSGPHVFVDQNGIWVFSPLTKTGTHSPSWNCCAWGVEQLGNFETEDYNSGQGLAIRNNSVAALSILSIALDINIDTLRFHKEDRHTTHKSCPGKSCQKSEVISIVKKELENWRKKWNALQKS